MVVLAVWSSTYGLMQRISYVRGGETWSVEYSLDYVEYSPDYWLVMNESMLIGIT